MLNFFRGLFARDARLKALALFLALALWFYIVNELKKGSEEERHFLQSVMPKEGLSAKKLEIYPVFSGKPKSGYFVDGKKTIVVPEYCLVVGTRDLVEKIRHAYTMPIDIAGAGKSFTKSVPLSPIAPGIYMEETLVQVTVPVEKSETNVEVNRDIKK